MIRIVGVAEYRALLTTTLDGVDPAYADDRGDGAMRILGVGTCGPADPARRSYHLAYTAGIRPDSGEPQRWLGSLEFTLRGGEWSSSLLFADDVSAWRTTYDDPFAELACGNGRSWSTR